MNAVSKKINGKGLYEMNSIRRITDQNVQHCQNPKDLQFFQMTDGSYVLFQLENNEVQINSITEELSETDIIFAI